MNPCPEFPSRKEVDELTLQDISQTQELFWKGRSLIKKRGALRSRKKAKKERAESPHVVDKGRRKTKYSLSPKKTKGKGP